MNLTKQQEKLFEFVKECHGDQVRKYTGEPYWHHLYNVAKIVSIRVPNTIEIALCHDLLEDTKCTKMELSNFLTKNCNYTVGYAVSITNGVLNLTDKFTHEAYPDMNREARKAEEAYRMSYIGGVCQSVKYADIIDNTRSIVQHDKSFAWIYLSEIVFLLSKIRKGNINLLLECGYEIQKSLNELNQYTVQNQG